MCTCNSSLHPTCSCLPCHHTSYFSPSPHLFLSVPSPPLSLSRLHSNNLQCDCHVAWLSEWLRQRPRLGLYTQCMAPPHLRGHNVAEVQKKEFVCTGRSGSPVCFAVCFVTSLGSLFRSGKPIFCFVSSAFSHYLFCS